MTPGLPGDAVRAVEGRDAAKLPTTIAASAIMNTVRAASDRLDPCRGKLKFLVTPGLEPVLEGGLLFLSSPDTLVSGNRARTSRHDGNPRRRRGLKAGRCPRAKPEFGRSRPVSL